MAWQYERPYARSGVGHQPPSQIRTAGVSKELEWSGRRILHFKHLESHISFDFPEEPPAASTASSRRQPSPIGRSRRSGREEMSETAKRIWDCGFPDDSQQRRHAKKVFHTPRTTSTSSTTIEQQAISHHRQPPTTPLAAAEEVAVRACAKQRNGTGGMFGACVFPENSRPFNGGRRHISAPEDAMDGCYMAKDQQRAVTPPPGSRGRHHVPNSPEAQVPTDRVLVVEKQAPPKGKRLGLRCGMQPRGDLPVGWGLVGESQRREDRGLKCHYFDDEKTGFEYD